MNEANFQKFGEAYREGLREALDMDAKRMPEDRRYAYTVHHDYESVVDRMLRSIRETPMGVNYNSDGLRRTCKKLGIKFTRKAILEFLGLS